MVLLTRLPFSIKVFKLANCGMAMLIHLLRTQALWLVSFTASSARGAIGDDTRETETKSIKFDPCGPTQRPRSSDARRSSNIAHGYETAHTP